MSDASVPTPASSSAPPPAPLHAGAEHSSVERFDELSSEIRRLGNALGSVIEKVEGKATLETVERLRKLAKSARQGDTSAWDELAGEVKNLDTHEGFEVAMAFTTYFELVNLAEENFRTRILRERRTAMRENPDAPPMRETIEDAIRSLKADGVDARAMQHLLDQLAIELVFTAHPTESKRRTVLTKLHRLAEMLRRHHAPAEHRWIDTAEADLEREVASLWLTDRARTARPQVTDEVRTALWYFDVTLWDTLPQLQHDLENALARHYPEVHPPSRWLTFGSWVGGDRDGNPNVTARVTATSLVLMRRLALRKLRESTQAVARLLSVSTRRDRISAELHDLLNESAHLSEHVEKLVDRYPNEPYRLLLAGLGARLESALERTTTGGLMSAPEAGDDRDTPRTLRTADVSHVLHCLAESLRQSRGGVLLTEGELRHLTNQLRIFGLHIARLDLRQHSKRHEQAVAELLESHPGPSYADLDESARVQLLGEIIAEPHALDDMKSRVTKLSEQAEEIVAPLSLISRAQRLYGNEIAGVYIISMTSSLSDVLEVLFLMRWTGAELSIAPLLETLADLDAAPAILRGMFAHPAYRQHLRRRADQQVIMVGYSDSNKDCGYITAQWGLFRAQDNIAAVCRAERIRLTLFHGRGGSVARGGGPAAEAILAQPVGLRDGSIRITEQGEVLSTRYHNPDLAHRILEQVTYGVLRGAAQAQQDFQIPDAWRDAMDAVAEAGVAKYRSLVHDDPEFIEFWNQATPIDVIGRLNLGSRPTYRGLAKGVEDLRAIPWVFSWMQARFNFPGWFGLGSGLAAVLDRGGEGLEVLQTMYREWAFFQTSLDNAQLTLVKADMGIARRYASLVKNETLRERVFATISEEYERTVASLLKVTSQDVLLEKQPVLLRSVQLRNPYIDPLSILQVEMLRRLRRHEELTGADSLDDDAMRAVIELTVNGVSHGLKNTG